MGTQIRYAVVGAGVPGRAMAGHLALMGYPVTLFDPDEARLEAVRQQGGIELSSTSRLGPSGLGVPDTIASHPDAAVAGAQVVMVTTSPGAHAAVAEMLAAYLEDGQIVVLHPGYACGAIEFARVLGKHGCEADVTVAEASTMVYSCRSNTSPAVHIARLKDAIPLAALPAVRTARVLETLKPAYPQFIDGGSVLHTGLNNTGEVFHPALVLLNAGRIESTRGNYQFYIQGVTLRVARALEALDRERVAVAAALGIQAMTAREWLEQAYDAQGGSLLEAIHSNPGYYDIFAPSSLNHRYISDNVPYNVVPLAALGRQYGVTVRTMEAVVDLACIAHGADYWRTGRTLDRLGLGTLSVDALMRCVMETGILPDALRSGVSR